MPHRTTQTLGTLSLRRRFQILTACFLTLVVVMLGLVRYQMQEVRQTRHRLEEDWKEIRLLFDIQGGLSSIHSEFEDNGPQADTGVIGGRLARLVEKAQRVHRAAAADLAGIDAEESELLAIEELTESLRDWQELNGRVATGSLGAGETRLAINELYDKSTKAITDYSRGSLAELEHSLESLDAREEQLEATAGYLALALVALLALAWAGFSLWFMRPIGQLRRMVARVRDHDFRAEAMPIAPDEIGEVMQSFREMAGELQAFTADLEERVRVRTAELDASRRQLREMLDGLPEAVALVEGDSGRVLLANKPWRVLFAGREYSPVGDLLAAPPNADGTHTLSGKDGEPRLVAIHRISLGGGGEAPVMLEHVSDVTTQVRTQAALASTQKLASIGRLSAGLAHEINNPLTAIAACAEGLLRRARSAVSDDGTFVEYLGTIRDEVFRCKEITGKLLDFSRTREARFEWCEAGELVGDAVRLTDHLASKGSVRIETRCHDVPRFFSDPATIRQVLLNLILNAIEACHAGCVITVACAVEGEWCLFSVRDDGRGIEAPDLPRIFEPFFSRRLDGTGTGLGLFVCTGLAQALGGSIEASSAGPGLGSTFVLRLPHHGTVDGSATPTHEVEAIHA